MQLFFNDGSIKTALYIAFGTIVNEWLQWQNAFSKMQQEIFLHFFLLHVTVCVTLLVANAML